MRMTDTAYAVRVLLRTWGKPSALARYLRENDLYRLLRGGGAHVAHR